MLVKNMYYLNDMHFNVILSDSLYTKFIHCMMDRKTIRNIRKKEGICQLATLPTFKGKSTLIVVLFLLLMLKTTQGRILVPEQQGKEGWIQVFVVSKPLR